MLSLKHLPLTVLTEQLTRCQLRLQQSLGPCELRLLTSQDIPALLGLERYCFSPQLAFGRRRWRNLLNHSGCQTLGVWQGDVLLAYLCLFPHLGWRAPGSALSGGALALSAARSGLGPVGAG